MPRPQPLSDCIFEPCDGEWPPVKNTFINFPSEPIISEDGPKTTPAKLARRLLSPLADVQLNSTVPADAFRQPHVVKIGGNIQTIKLADFLPKHSIAPQDNDEKSTLRADAPAFEIDRRPSLPLSENICYERNSVAQQFDFDQYRVVNNCTPPPPPSGPKQPPSSKAIPNCEALVQARLIATQAQASCAATMLGPRRDMYGQFMMGRP